MTGPAADAPETMTACPGAIGRRRKRQRPFRVRAVVSAPFTYGYLLLLLATTLLLRHVSPRVADRLLASSSTDVAHLTHDPLRVLLASALWLPGRWWLPYAVVLLLVLAPLERRFGVRRAALVFLSGHVLATLLTELPIAAAIMTGWVAPAAAHRLDVGVSYGTYAAVAAFAGSLRRRHTVVLLAVALVSIVAPVATDPDMTMYGHLLALAIGTCWWPALYGGASRRRPPLAGLSPTPRAPAERPAERSGACDDPAQRPVAGPPSVGLQGVAVVGAAPEGNVLGGVGSGVRRVGE